MIDEKHAKALARATEEINRKLGTEWSEQDTLNLAITHVLGSVSMLSDEQLRTFASVNIDKLEAMMRDYVLFEKAAASMRKIGQDIKEEIGEVIKVHRGTKSS